MKYQAAFRYLNMHLMMLTVSCVGSLAKSLRYVPLERKLQDKKLMIGMNVMLTNHETMADEVKRVTDMWTKGIEEAGGIQVGAGGEPYQVDLKILDNGNDIEKAKKNAQDLIDQGVLAMVGPYWSSRAIPAGEVANDGNTTMISPPSTNPATTLDRPYVFRAAFVDSFQGPMIAKFVSENYPYKNVAIVHECEDPYSSGLAGYFKEAWESDNGGTVSSDTCIDSSKNEEELTTDISSAAATVAQSGAEFLFLPTYAAVGLQMIQELSALPEWGSAAIEKQAEGDAVKKLIIVGDSTLDYPALAENCLEPCEGVIAVKLFDPLAEGNTTQKFVSEFATLYDDLVPTDYEALTWDSLNLVKEAIENCGAITGDLSKDRDCVKDAMAATKDFPGVAGNITFDSNGDPEKCVNFAEVVSGELKSLAQACPDSDDE
jgi:branched-chain amino acid transport system substrate-binding protein